jgi:cephalosporin-C deacetylase-like acetyl esterase
MCPPFFRKKFTYGFVTAQADWVFRVFFGMLSRGLSQTLQKTPPAEQLLGFSTKQMIDRFKQALYNQLVFRQT